MTRGARGKWLLVFVLAGTAAAPAIGEPPDGSGRIDVAVSELGNDDGVVRVALLDSQQSYEDEAAAFRQAEAKIADGRARVRFEHVPYGTYAIKLFHDENENGKLDTNFIGLPKEAFGFSNNAMGRFGPPGYDDAKFVLDVSELRMEIRARSL